ncbi:hypothetical protein SBV1_1060017 [Verrucomicrobia bacterium]|nr:hypothetical protein SBV1_1060017 [Verrucomicrobiota bacterium]
MSYSPIILGRYLPFCLFRPSNQAKYPRLPTLRRSAVHASDIVVVERDPGSEAPAEPLSLR